MRSTWPLLLATPSRNNDKLVVGGMSLRLFVNNNMLGHAFKYPKETRSCFTTPAADVLMKKMATFWISLTMPSFESDNFFASQTRNLRPVDCYNKDVTICFQRVTWIIYANRSYGSQNTPFPFGFLERPFLLSMKWTRSIRPWMWAVINLITVTS